MSGPDCSQGRTDNSFRIPRPRENPRGNPSAECKTFILQTMQFSQCSRFRHMVSRVKTRFCGKSTHGDDPCDEPMKYINCGGQHSSRSHNCPMYKNDVTIQEMETLKNIRYLEVKKVVGPAYQGKVSYAQAVKSTPAVTSSAVKEIMPAVTRFIERYLE